MSDDKNKAPDLYEELANIINDEPETRTLVQLELFRNLLREGLNQGTIDINHWYEDPYYATMLDMACWPSGSGAFIEELLLQGADPNTINKMSDLGPIHTIIEKKNDIEALQILLKHENTDVNLQDAMGRTALHIVCKKNKDPEINKKYYQIFKILLNQKQILVNLIDKKGKTAIYVAALHEQKDIVLDLLKFKGIDVDTAESAQGKTARDIILEKFPDLAAEIPDKSAPTQKIPVARQLFYYLDKRKEEAFISSLNKLKDKPNNIEEIKTSSDGTYTFLQYASNYGFVESVKLLLELGVDPNGTSTQRTNTPIMLASYKGYVDIVRNLYEHEKTSLEPIDGDNVLLCAIQGIVSARYSREENTGHYDCLKYLLDKSREDARINLNHIDDKGSTGLHYAARLEDPELILILLRAGIYIGTRNIFNQPALQDMPHDVWKDYLDECVQTGPENRRKDDPNYQLVFNYDFLVPPKIETKNNRDSAQDNTREKEDEGIVRIEMEPGTGRKTTSQAKEHKLATVTETDPFLYMSENEDLRPLLCHPVIDSFIYLKWCSVRKFFFLNLGFFLIYWLLLSFYILYVNEKISNGDDSSHVVFRILLGILLVAFITRELFQIIQSPYCYFESMDNWLELSLILVTGAIVCNSYGSRQHEISAIAILLSWSELALIIARHPSVATSYEMLKIVTKSFLKLGAWYSIFIFAFGLCFYMLFKDSAPDDNKFVGPLASIFKTFIMSTGEFDSGSIPMENYSPYAQILFALFVFSIAIILLNILQGVAVSDTDVILKESKLLANISTIKFICSTENTAISDSKLSKLYNLFGNKFNLLKTNLFPDIISEEKIFVYPNKDGKVGFSSEDKKCITKPDDTISYFMNSDIVKEAKALVDQRKTKSHSTEERLENLEKTSRQNQEILKEILSSLNTK
uniref:Transient receptor potential cation channel protein painless n=1 Tax=Cacopsylla melanoneura TaxID=428564 RepID=A0A8D9BYS8_9HEMI